MGLGMRAALGGPSATPPTAPGGAITITVPTRCAGRWPSGGEGVLTRRRLLAARWMIVYICTARAAPRKNKFQYVLSKR